MFLFIGRNRICTKGLELWICYEPYSWPIIRSAILSSIIIGGIMKFEHGVFEFKNGVLISVWQNLTEIFQMRKFNWSTFQLILVEFENDRAMQGLEVTLVFLCCGFRLRIPTSPTEEHKVHKEVSKNFDKILNDSAHGYTSVKGWNAFKKATGQILLIRKEKPKGHGPQRKMFIQ